MSRMSTAQTTTTPMTQQTSKVSHEKIAVRAYEKWCQRGRPQGTHVQDWLDAERELQMETTKSGTSNTHRR